MPAAPFRLKCGSHTIQTRDDPIGRVAGAACARLHEERPEGVANLGREHALEILERRSSKLSVVRVQAAKRNLQRLSREDQRQERKDVRKALAGTISHDFVDG